ncbi:hypothetical protein Tco_0425093 [Tanacetum coccineum]
MEQEEIMNESDSEKARDIDQENGDLLSFLVFLVTNIFASVYEQVVENMNVNTSREKKEVHVEDVEMDEDHKVDVTKNNKALQWGLGEDPFLVFMELKDQLISVQRTIPSSISNEVAIAKGKRKDIASANG